MDDLSGNVVACSAKHQVCLPCFNLLPKSGGVRKCPLCNVPSYTIDEMRKVERMNGQEVAKEPYFYLDLCSGRNSRYDFAYNEALFLNLIKITARNNIADMDTFRTMLMSSFYNFYLTHPDAFSTYTFACLYQTNGNHRTINPTTDELPQAFQEYLLALQNPEAYKKIYDDVAYTQIGMYSYQDIVFYRELELVEGNIERLKDYPDGRKDILKREVYFRYKVSRSNPEELKQYLKNTLMRIANRATSYHNYFKTEKKQIN